VLARQFTPVGAVVALLGVQQRWKERAVGEGLALLLISVYAIGYNTTDSLVYLTPFLPVFALWLGDGITVLAERNIPSTVGVLIPVTLLLVNWAAMDLSGEHTPRRWAEQILTEAPAEAVLVTSQDAHTFTLWYAQEVVGLRPDVVILDRDLWAQAFYRTFLEDNYNRVISAPGASGQCDVTEAGVRCP
jgi:hypothetical protein